MRCSLLSKELGASGGQKEGLSASCHTCEAEDAFTVLSEQRVARGVDDKLFAAVVREVHLVACGCGKSTPCGNPSSVQMQDGNTNVPRRIATAEKGPAAQFPSSRSDEYAR